MLIADPKSDVRGPKQADAQEWLNQRFAGLRLRDIHQDGMMIYSATDLDAPPGFENVWNVASRCNDFKYLVMEQHVVDIKKAAVVLLLANPRVQTEVDCLCMMSQIIDQLGDNCPPIFWLQHSMNAENGNHLDDFTVVDRAMHNGVDDVLPSEPVGSELALILRMRINKQSMMSKKVSNAVNQRRQCAQRVDELRQSINCILWTYLRLRLRLLDIPALDPEITPGQPALVDGYQLLDEIGHGHIGRVYSLALPSGPCQEVMKCIAKWQISDLAGLMSIARQIKIMNLLTNEHPHPNLMRFLKAYHSETHIMFRLQRGGDLNLFERLRLREKDERAMSCPKIVKVVSQAIDVIEHLHSKCHVAHLDIKPENVCIFKEADDDIVIKLLDFDVARTVQPDERIKAVCGTFPFMAPEMMSAHSMLPFPADVWSLGILVCEMVCCADVLDRVLQFTEFLERHQPGHGHRWRHASARVTRMLMGHVSGYFEEEDAVGRILRAHLRPELREIAENLQILLARMIRTQPDRRASTTSLLQLRAFETMVDVPDGEEATTSAPQ